MHPNTVATCFLIEIVYYCNWFIKTLSDINENKTVSWWLLPLIMYIAAIFDFEVGFIKLGTELFMFSTSVLTTSNINFIIFSISLKIHQQTSACSSDFCACACCLFHLKWLSQKYDDCKSNHEQKKRNMDAWFELLQRLVSIEINISIIYRFSTRTQKSWWEITSTFSSLCLLGR